MRGIAAVTRSLTIAPGTRSFIPLRGWIESRLLGCDKE
jgi:hypothetical protein